MLPSPRPARKRLGGPTALLSCCDACFPERTESPHHLPCTLLESPLSSAFVSFTAPFYTPAQSTRVGEELSDANRGEGGEEPRRAASRPKGRRWPSHHKFGTFAQIQSPDLCRCFSTPTINAPKQPDSYGSKAHFSSGLTCSEHCQVLPARVSPRSPSTLHLNIPNIPEASPRIQGNPEGQ